ncbi:MAG: hypothetical protein L6Q97_11225, partial [Thermoanaerobaculia bacterium]|nr:hypothetical protein [Thermoanaerobaculia bacterium]
VVSVSTGMLGGIRAALAMQQLVLGISGYPIPQMLPVGQVSQRFDGEGNLLDPSFEKNIDTFLRHFTWLAEAVTEKKIADDLRLTTVDLRLGVAGSVLNLKNRSTIIRQPQVVSQRS